MRGIPGTAFFIFLFFIVIVEVLAYLSVWQLLSNTKKRKTVSYLYWGLSVTLLAIWLGAFINPESIRETRNYQFFYFTISVTALNIFPKLIISVSLIVSSILRLFKAKNASKIILMSGMILSLGMLLTIGWAISWGRNSYRIEKIEIPIQSLPAGLDGLSIIQLSDIHLGSFQDDGFMKECATAVNQLNPDLILFTGDMVNNYYSEMIGFEDELAEMKASYGKYAILGNHDYGDYSKWLTEEAKEENHNQLCDAIENAGFHLLLNDAARIEVRDTSLYIIGVENWGHPPFPQYAKLEEAIDGLSKNEFKILLSHDPAHWDAKVLPNTNIPLTLSGHTHAAQTGFRIAGIEFSPMYFIQKYWGGLYEKNGRFLYVNRGLGCVGLLGRIDMKPEITWIHLKSDGIKAYGK